MPRKRRPFVPRALRAPTASIEARLGGESGRLLNISTTGALLRTAVPFELGTQYPMVLNLADAPPRLVVRVVRAERVAVELHDGPPGWSQYVIGVTFAEVPALAKHTITTLCEAALLQPDAV
jgi:hypothetical protein